MPDADYFSAADDESAVAVIEAGVPVRAALDVIFLKDIDPVDAIAQVEAVCPAAVMKRQAGARGWDSGCPLRTSTARSS
ncbi:hypothetical protein [Streptomyces sp. NPDC001492]